MSVSTRTYAYKRKCPRLGIDRHYVKAILRSFPLNSVGVSKAVPGRRILHHYVKNTACGKPKLVNVVVTRKVTYIDATAPRRQNVSFSLLS